jgi:RNA polymerase sigma-70 factor (ECF subfamily)
MKDQRSAGLQISESLATLTPFFLNLCPEEREALFLHEVEGYSASEISRMIGEPRGTVLSLMHRGRQRLLRMAENEEKSVE